MQWIGVGCLVWTILGLVIAWGFSRFQRWLRGDFDVLNDREERFGNWRH